MLSSEVTSTGASAGLAESAGSYLYLKDGLGSVMAVTTTDGDLVQRYVYSSFGKLLKTVDGAGLEATSFKTAYTYTNRELDEETGLYYYRARYYDPASGRFLTEDPHPGKLGSPISHVNKYIYTSNNPINLVDPSGLFNIGRELGSFFGGSGGWEGDLITAAVVVGVIVAPGGTLGPAMWAVASVAGGAAAAALASKQFSGGSFDENFHSFFRVSATMLALSAATLGGAGVGGNGLHASVKGGSGGMTVGSASFGEAGVASHEFGHTLQFIALAAGNKNPTDTWEQYAIMGGIGLAIGWTSLQAGGAYDAWYNPWEYSASFAGGGFL